MSSTAPVIPPSRRLAVPDSADRTPLYQYIRASGLRSIVMGASKDPNAKVTVLLISPESGLPVLAVKAPTTDRAARAVEAEARALQELAESGLPGAGEAIPRVVDIVDLEGRAAVVMTAVQGTPMSTLYLRRRHTASPARAAADFAAAEAWLSGFQGGSVGPPAPIDMNGGAASLLRSRFDGEDGLDGDLDRLAETCAKLARHDVPRTAVHGDFWFGNLLVSKGNVSGVVDWEAASAPGEPVRDIARFALMYALYLDCRTRPGRRVAGHSDLRTGPWGAGVQYALDGSGWFPDLFRRFIGAGLARLGAPLAIWRDVALAGIAEVAALTDDDVFARRHLELFRRLYRPAVAEERPR
jgi:aminoglycoside phosphotransferase